MSIAESGDIVASGALVGKTLTLTTASITDAIIQAAAGIKSTKLQHRNSYTVELFGPTTTVAALTKWIAAIRGATGSVVSINAYVAVQATGADRTVTLDLQKSTGGGAFATVLSATCAITNGTVIRTATAGTVSTPGLVVGDLLEIVVTVAGAAGAQATGLTAVVVVDEDAQEMAADPEALYLLTAEDVDRLREVLREAEEANPVANYRPKKPRHTPALQSAEVDVIRVTSPSRGTYGYPAFIQSVTPPTNSDPANTPPHFADAGDCWAVGPNNEPLLAVYYLARRGGNAPDTNAFPIFEVCGTVGITIQTLSGSVVVPGVEILKVQDTDFLLSQPQPAIAVLGTQGFSGNVTGVTGLACNGDGTITVSSVTQVFQNGLLKKVM